MRGYNPFLGGEGGGWKGPLVASSLILVNARCSDDYN